MLILCGSRKGGTGKSTLAIHLAIERAMMGHAVLLIDADPQATTARWIARRHAAGLHPPMAVEQVLGWEGIVSLTEREYDNFESIIIDVAGRDSEELRRTLSFVDVLVSPICPTMNDLDTAEEMDDIVGRLLVGGDQLPLRKALFTISRANPNPFMWQQINDAREFLSQYTNMTVSRAVMFARAAYEKASIAGASVTELSPTDHKAVYDLKLLCKEVFDD